MIRYNSWRTILYRYNHNASITWYNLIKNFWLHLRVLTEAICLQYTYTYICIYGGPLYKCKFAAGRDLRVRSIFDGKKGVKW